MQHVPVYHRHLRLRLHQCLRCYYQIDYMKHPLTTMPPFLLPLQFLRKHLRTSSSLCGSPSLRWHLPTDHLIYLRLHHCYWLRTIVSFLLLPCHRVVQAPARAPLRPAVEAQPRARPPPRRSPAPPRARARAPTRRSRARAARGRCAGGAGSSRARALAGRDELVGGA